MASFSVTGTDGVLRADGSSSAWSALASGFSPAAQRMVLLTLIQRMTSDVATESFLAEAVGLLEHRLGLLGVTISLSNSMVPETGFPSSFGSASSFFGLSQASHQEPSESRVEVPVLLNNVAVGSVGCRISPRSDLLISPEVEQYLALVAALLACHVRMSQAGNAESASGPTAKLPDKTWAIQRTMILQALKQTKGNMAAAARHLGITPRIIRYKVRKLRIDPKQWLMI